MPQPIRRLAYIQVVALRSSPMSEATGIDHDRVGAWLDANVVTAQGPYHYTLIAGGHSNLTFAVEDSGGGRYVLRRPPVSHVLAGAHDMGREYRIIAALHRTTVPVPSALGFCDDLDVNGAPFYVMGFVDGTVVRTKEQGEKLTPDQRWAAGMSLADTMAAIHGVDVDTIGLGDLGRHDGYIARQLKRWYSNWQTQRTRELPAVDQVHDELARRIPDQQGVSVVHGDYRLDNCIVGPDGRIVAVLDWEICTLGDPMADVGLLQVYHTGPDDVPSAWTPDATTLRGFPNRADLLRRYGEVTGRDLSHIDFYVAFAFWKLACILEGVYARYLGGALGQRNPAELAPFKMQVEAAAQRAVDALAQLG